MNIPLKIAHYIFYIIHNTYEKYAIHKFCEYIIRIHKLCKVIRQSNSIDLITKSSDSLDKTVKYTFLTFDKKEFYSVLLLNKGKLTLCLSSQIGCKVKCKFCATAYTSFNRNLTISEILQQIYIINKEQTYLKIGRFIYMGMGEPLQNINNVVNSILILSNIKGKCIGKKNIRISTSCCIKNFTKISEITQTYLTISLHSILQSTRNHIITKNKQVDILNIFRQLKKYFRRNFRKVTIAYLLLKSINDSYSHIALLIQFLLHINCNVNLIPFNKHKFYYINDSSLEDLKLIQTLLLKSGFSIFIRFPKGNIIQAACGMLVKN